MIAGAMPSDNHDFAIEDPRKSAIRPYASTGGQGADEGLRSAVRVYRRAPTGGQYLWRRRSHGAGEKRGACSREYGCAPLGSLVTAADVVRRVLSAGCSRRSIVPASIAGDLSLGADRDHRVAEAKVELDPWPSLSVGSTINVARHRGTTSSAR